MMSSAATAKHTLQLIQQTGTAIGLFFYGTEIRTKRSITFSYLCISLYILAVINADYLGACMS